MPKLNHFSIFHFTLVYNLKAQILNLHLKHMRKYIIALIASFLLFFSCQKDEVIPICIEEELEEFKMEACEGTADLTTWNFNGRTVYCFFYGLCTEDSKAVIFDAQCNELCSLFGLSGNTVCEGIVWDGNARRLATLYVHN